jgi:hypothetical protein
MINEYPVLSSSEVNATTRTLRSALSSHHRLGGGPEQALEQVIALSVVPPPAGAEMLSSRLWRDGRLAAAKKANQRQGCNSTCIIKKTLLIPFNLPA